MSAGVEAVALAQAELRALVYRLADEVAAFRRRALTAESRQRELEQSLQAHLPDLAPSPAVPDHGEGELTTEALMARVAELERQNGGLRDRLERASERTTLLLERTRFLRQQQEQARVEEAG